ncbi:MAG: glycosyltransferase family 4 protein [Candidatus Nomurabacteria bacterium]|nr:MAG: glycosyltransferase family 4 protein [Candidatus Nomurabacteria bacterium]
MTKRIRIAMIGQKGIPTRYGGVERHVEELSADLVQRGFVVTAYTRPYYTPQHRRWHRGVQLVSLPTVHTKHFDAITHTFFASLHAIWKGHDVIHYHGVGPSLMSWLPRLLRPSTRVVTTFHCIDRHHEKWGLLARLMLQAGEWTATHFAHTTIAVSKTIQTYIAEEYGRDSLYIPNGVSRSPRYSLRSVLRRFNLQRDAYFLAVTRLVQHKGVLELIRAYRASGSRLPLVIVGGSAATDRYVQQLHAEAADLPQVKFLGYQSPRTVQSLFQGARAFVHASRAEGLPIVVLEAMEAGVPIIASDIPEHRELLRPEIGGEYGRLFPVNDIDALALQLKEIGRQSKQRLQVAGAAQRFVRRALQWKSVSAKTAELYDEQLEPKKQSVRVEDYSLA